MKNRKVIIYGKDNYWNWRYEDGLCDIPIYGKTFETKEQAIKNAKEWLKNMSISAYDLEEEKEEII